MSVDRAAWPETFYVFVSRARWATRHQYEHSGALVSAAFAAVFPEALPPGLIVPDTSGDRANRQGQFIQGTLDHLPFIPNPHFVGPPNPFIVSTTDDYRAEYDAEMARRMHVPQAPSRLSAVYALGDESSCEAVSRRYGWPLSDVRPFRLQQHPHARVWKANMEIVSLARAVYQPGSWRPVDLDRIWRGYWLGEPSVRVDLPLDGRGFESVTSGCIWEYLIEGVLEAVEPSEARQGSVGR